MIAPCRMIARGSGASFASAKCVAVVVHKIALQQATEVPLVEDDHVVQTFPPHRSDQPLDESSLPGTPRGSDDFAYSEHLNTKAKAAAIDRATIGDQITLRVPLRERFDDLLRRPFGGRMFGDPEVKDLSPLGLDDKKDEQNPQTNRRHGEEINGDDIANVIPEEGLPGLRWWPPDRPQQAG